MPGPLEGIVRLLGPRSRPEVPWISSVLGCSLEEARDSVEGLAGHAAYVRELSDKIRRTGRSYYAQFPAPIELYAFVRMTQPTTLVESGVASGVSSTFLLLGAKVNGGGVLHSIDLPVSRREGRGNEPWAIPSGLHSGWAVPGVLKERWDLRQGRSEDLLVPLLKEVGALDFYCHDSPVDTKHFAFEMKAIKAHLRPGSLVIADNTDRDVFDDTARSVGAKAVHRRHSSLGAFRVPGR
jgi:hypothetical protein